jgi:hypothetical protein
MNSIHIISKFIFREPDVLIGGSANIFFAELLRSTNKSSGMLISRFPMDEPRAYFKKCISIRPGYFDGRLGAIEFVIRSILETRHQLKSSVNEIPALFIHIGLYGYLPFYIIFSKFFLKNTNITFSLYCPPKKGFLDAFAVLLLNRFQSYTVRVLSRNVG